jgi:hypothetical protein
MSPVCQLEMTLPESYPGGVRGDGSADGDGEGDAARGDGGFGNLAQRLAVMPCCAGRVRRQRGVISTLRAG